MLRYQQRGVTVVELALILTVLLLIIFGTMELGRAVWYYNTLGYAAREGTRFAAVNGSTSGSAPGPRLYTEVDPLVKAKVVAAATGLALSASNVTVTWSPNNKPGSQVAVTVTKTFSPAIGLFTGFAMSRSSSLVIVR